MACKPPNPVRNLKRGHACGGYGGRDSVAPTVDIRSATIKSNVYARLDGVEPQCPLASHALATDTKQAEYNDFIISLGDLNAKENN